MNLELIRETILERSARTKALKRLRQALLPPLRLRVSERKLLLMFMDVLLVNAALAIALLIWWTEFPLSGRALLINWRWFFTLTLEWLIWAAFFDCYDLARSADSWQGVVRSGPAALAVAATYTLTPLFTPSLQSRGLIFTFTLTALASVVAWRAAYAQLFVQPWFEQRALVVGAGWAGRELVAALQDAPEGTPNPFQGTGYRIVGFVDDNPEYQDVCFHDVRVLGDSNDLVHLARELEVNEVILAITHRHAIQEHLFDALLRCREQGYGVITMSVLYERLLGRVPVEHVGRDLPMVLPMADEPGQRLYHAVKRMFDLLLALGGLAAAAALTPCVALWNAMASPGPLLYRQERVGRAGETFQMLKFRTMNPEAECDGCAVWACRHDERITPIGHLLRATRLDELPQCWNVLCGHMSIIGPRPERPEFVEGLAERLPFYRARHAIRPGITGWAQTQFEYGNTVEDAKVKLEYDLYYVKNATPWLDLRILLRTVWVMLAMKGF